MTTASDLILPPPRPAPVRGASADRANPNASPETTANRRNRRSVPAGGRRVRHDGVHADRAVHGATDHRGSRAHSTRHFTPGADACTDPDANSDPDPDPTPQDNRKSWTLRPAHFRDDDAAIYAETSNRSDPIAWDRITADNAANVRVSIGGNDLPFTSTAYQPAFASDFSGAEWSVRAEVQTGEVVLVLEAPDQRRILGDVESITLTNPGSGYTSAPTVSFSGGGGSGATATATAADRVASLTLTSPGSGYTASPTVAFSGGGGSGAAATAIALADAVASVTITDKGFNYLATSTVTFSAPPSGTTATGTVNRYDEVREVEVLIAGSGWASAPTVSFSGGGGSGATATATVSGGKLTAITITNGGSGYTSTPTVSLSGGGGSGATVSSGYGPDWIKSVTITNSGSGYTSAPTVTFSGGEHGKGTAVLGRIASSLTLTAGGSGYTSDPAVTFTGGGGSGATATAKVKRTGYAQSDNLYWGRQALYGKELVVEVVED